MSVFGEPKFPKHLTELKKRVSSREGESVLKLEWAWIDFNDRLMIAEQKVISDFDAHALEAESVMKELSNRGEQVTAAVSDVSGQNTEAENPNKTFLASPNQLGVATDVPPGQAGGEGALTTSATFPDASEQAAE